MSSASAHSFPDARSAKRNRSGSSSNGKRGVGRDAAPPNRYWVLFTVVFGAFAAILDSTIVNTALPTIQTALGATLHRASYVATAYILASGVIVPLTSYLSNKFGVKRIYLLSLALFTIGSGLCGLAPNIGVLIAFRVLQGAGGAALFPLAFAILFDVFPDEERGKANGIFGIPVLVAPAIGPTVGGFLAQYVGWQSIFYVNLPIGIIGILMGLKFLRENVSQPHRKLDLTGFVLVAAGLALLLYGLTNLAYDSLSNIESVSGPIVLGVILLIVFALVDLRRAQPILDLRLYCKRNFLIGNIITWVATVGLFVPAFLLPQYLQTLRGLSPVDAGLLLLAQGVGAVLGSFLSGQLYNRLGPRVLILTGGLATLVTGYLLAGWVGASAGYIFLIVILFPRGLGLPIITQPTNTTSLDGIYGPKLPEATTLNVVARNVIASLAIAITTNILQSQTTAYLSRFGASALRYVAETGTIGAVRAHEPAGVIRGQALAYHDVFLITALTILPAFFLVFFLRRTPRAETKHVGAEPGRPTASATSNEQPAGSPQTGVQSPTEQATANPPTQPPRPTPRTGRTGSQHPAPERHKPSDEDAPRPTANAR